MISNEKIATWFKEKQNLNIKKLRKKLEKGLLTKQKDTNI